ncbi:hypothetical protein FNF28_05867 [Cafeteria roenbergensis]|uniref:Uncharacterized protein n=2 Tax=Cafeteria roenbergensis TaxID=33653 RepID=A0A5A8D3P1_CAFRO|nr:hypothetical protein FNF28_05867 [Cafeteria roenbergensis]
MAAAALRSSVYPASVLLQGNASFSSWRGGVAVTQLVHDDTYGAVVMGTTSSAGGIDRIAVPAASALGFSAAVLPDLTRDSRADAIALGAPSFSVQSASSPDEGLVVLQSFSPDLRMPETNWLETYLSRTQGLSHGGGLSEIGSGWRFGHSIAAFNLDLNTSLPTVNGTLVSTGSDELPEVLVGAPGAYNGSGALFVVSLGYSQYALGYDVIKASDLAFGFAPSGFGTAVAVLTGQSSLQTAFGQGSTQPLPSSTGNRLLTHSVVVTVTGSSTSPAMLLRLRRSSSSRWGATVDDSFPVTGFPSNISTLLGESVAYLGPLPGSAPAEAEVLVAFGAPGTDSDAGAVVISQMSAANGSVSRWSSFSASDLGFSAVPVPLRVGHSVSWLGDLDRNGWPDVAVGAPGNSSGSVMLVYLEPGIGANLVSVCSTASPGIGTVGQGLSGRAQFHASVLNASLVTAPSLNASEVALSEGGKALVPRSWALLRFSVPVCRVPMAAFSLVGLSPVPHELPVAVEAWDRLVGGCSSAWALAVRVQEDTSTMSVSGRSVLGCDAMDGGAASGPGATPRTGSSACGAEDLPSPLIWAASTGGRRVERGLREVLGAVGSAPGANGSGVVVNGSTRSTRLVVEVGFASPVSGFDAGRDLQLEGLQVVPAGLESGVVASPAPSRQAVWSVEVEATGASSRIAATLLPYGAHACSSSVLAVNSTSSQAVDDVGARCSSCLPRVAATDAAYSVQRQFNASVLNASLVTAPSLNASEVALSEGGKTLVPRSWALLRFSVPVCRVPMAAFSLVGLSPVPHELPVAVEAWDRLVGGCSSAWALAVRVQEDTSTMSVSGRSVLGCDAMDGGAASGPGATPRTGSSACGAEDLPSPLIWAASTGGDVSSAEYWSQVSSVSVFEDVDGDGRVSPVEAAEHALPASGPSDGAVSWRQCLVARVRFSSGVAGLSTSHIVVRGARVGGCGAASASAPFVSDPSSSFPSRVWDVPLVIDTAGDGLAVSVTLDGAQTGTTPRFNETSLVFSWQYRVRPTFIQLREVLGAVGSAPGANGSGVVVNGSTRSTRLVVEVGFASPVSGFDAGRDLQLEGLQVVPAGLESGVVASPAPSRQAVWSVEVEATGASSRIAATLLPYGAHACSSSVLAVNSTSSQAVDDVGARCSSCLPRVAATDAAYSVQRQFNASVLNASLVTAPSLNASEVALSEGGKTLVPRSWALLRFSVPVCRVPMAAFSLVGLSPVPHELPVAVEAWDRLVGGCSSAWALAVRVQEDTSTMSVSGRSVLGCDAMDGGAASGPGATPRTGSSACGAEDLPSPLIWAASTGGDVSSAEYWSQVSSVSVFEDVDGDGRVFPSRVWDVPLVIDTAGDGLAVSVTLDGAQTGTTPRFNETSLVFSWQYRVRPTFIQLREVLGAVGSAPGANGSGVVVNGSTRSTRLVVEVGFASPVSGFDAGRDLQLEGLQVVPAGLESGVVASPAPSRQAVWSVEVEATGASSRIAATLLPFSQSDSEHTSQYRTSCSFIAEVVASQLHAQVLNTLNQSASLVFATSNKTLVPRSWALLRFSVPVCRVPMAAFSLVGLSPVPHELPVAVEAWDRLVGGCSSAWALAVRVQEDTSTMSVSGRSVLGCDAMDGGAASGPGATPRTGSSACGAEDLPSPLIWAASTGGDVSSAEYWSQVSSVSVFEDVDGDGRVSPVEAAEHALPASGPSDGAVSWRQCLVARVRFSSGVAGLSTSHIVVRGARVGGCGAASASAPFVSDPSSSFPSRVWDVPLVIDTAGDGLAVSVTLDGAQTGTTPRFNETSLVFSWQYRVRPTFIQLREVLGAVGSAPGANGSGVVVNGSTRSTRLVVEVGFASPVSGFDAGRDLQLEGLQVVPAGLESGVVASPAPSRQAVWSVEVEATGASSRIAATLLPFGEFECFSSAVSLTHAAGLGSFGLCSTALPRIARTRAGSFVATGRFFVFPVSASIQELPVADPLLDTMEGNFTSALRLFMVLRYSAPVCRVPIHAFSVSGVQVSAEAVPFGLEQSERRSSGCSP